MQRNFIAWYLKGSNNSKDAALVAFVSPSSEDWRFSLVRMNYKFKQRPSGTIKLEEEITPPRRWSFLVGKNEKSHTAQSRFVTILQDDSRKPTLNEIEELFNIETVTKEFFDAYKYALNEIKEYLRSQGKGTEEEIHNFTQQLLSRLMFLYFIQRKGWFKWKDYTQDKNYVKTLWEKYKTSSSKKDTFYSEWLSPLFFYAFNKKHNYIKLSIPEEIKESFNLMPFLNGRLFSENELDKIGFRLPDKIFELLFEIDMIDKRKGFLELYNFTIKEDLPLDIEVAVNPEMLGKVYESLISEEERGSAGIFYTPRTEIDYMCKLSLVQYLAEETEIIKEKLVPIVFHPETIQENKEVKEEELRKIKTVLDNIKVVDPAVGSASFLVGMLNVLVNLQLNLLRKLEGREENIFAIKNKIILENLYGVDVKEWAVMVGELRLWLSLIIESDEKYMDIYTKPLLPNLSFKIRQGDSLVEEIADIPLYLRTKKYIPLSVREKIVTLIDKKYGFFRGDRSADLKEKQEIEEFENDILKDIVKSQINKIEGEIQKTLEDLLFKRPKKAPLIGEKIEQKGQFEEKLDRLKEDLDRLKKEKEELTKVLNKIENKKKRDYFLWEIDFVEVFEQKGGFDVVIGNPPYVRQEMIAFPLDRKEDFTPQDWQERKKLYKEKLSQAVKNLWGNDIKVDKKSDLYVYFYYAGLSLLKPGGIFCFINSNSWLDVGYGAKLQEFLLKNMEPLYIIDNIAKRSFAEADVNTVIVLIKRQFNKINLDDTVKFIAFKKPFEDVINIENLLEIEKTNERLIKEDFRVFPKTRKELLIEGAQIENEELFKNDPMVLSYSGNKWGGKYLRAPEIFFKILEKGNRYKIFNFNGEKIIIEDITDSIEGKGDTMFSKIATLTENNPGLNSLEKIKKAGYRIVKERDGERYFLAREDELKPLLVRLGDIAEVIAGVITGNNKKYYQPIQKPIPEGYSYIFKSPKEVKKILLLREDCITMIKTRDIPFKIKTADILWPDLRDDVHIWHINKDRIPFEHNFYGIKCHPDMVKGITLALNSTLSILFFEVLTRTGLGGGAARLVKIDILVYPIINPSLFEVSFRRVPEFFYRPISSVFEELGLILCHTHSCKRPEHPYEFINSEDVTFDKVMPDRRELDKFVFEALGLTEEEQLEVYRAVVELVKNRLVKAKSM